MKSTRSRSTASSKGTTSASLIPGTRSKTISRVMDAPARPSTRLARARSSNAAARRQSSNTSLTLDESELTQSSPSMNSAGLPSSSTNYSIIEHNVGIDLSPTGTIRENDAAHISIVDLASPSPTPVHRAFIRQPLEVDLTCDEEDISILNVVNPPRRDHDLPIVLGSSPPTARDTIRRNRRLVSRSSASNTDVTYYSIFALFSFLLLGSASPSVQEVFQSPASSERPPSPPGQENTRGIQCPICLESLAQIKSSNQQMHSTTCGHLFCGPCITRALASASHCPTCRKPLNTRKIHPVFI